MKHKNLKYQFLYFSMLSFGFILSTNSLVIEADATEVVSSINIQSEEQNIYNTNITSFNINTDIIEKQDNKIKIDGINNLAINNTNDITYIYEDADLTSKKLAILPPNGVCDIIDDESVTNLDTFLKKDSEYFIFVKSGEFEGYILSKDITMKNLEENFKYQTYAIVLSEAECYKEPNNTSEIIDLIKEDSIVEVLSYSDDNKYIKCIYNNEEVYIKTSLLNIKPFVDYAYEYEKSSEYKKANLDYKNREEFEQNIKEFALQFIGNKYVWGGTSLTNGADCSGFVQAIYRNFGYNIDRCAASQIDDGTSISEENLLPGDLVFYNDGSGISHVAMYIGDGQIIHASNRKAYPLGGIKISNYDYQTPCGYTRIVDF